MKPSITIAPYGSWSSPITSDLIAAHPVRLGDVAADGDAVYWIEARPWEGGRCVVVTLDAGGLPRDVIAAPFSARTLVHEYGGGALVVRDGTVWFTNLDPGHAHSDQRLYRVAASGAGAPVPVTPEVDARYADMTFDTGRHRLIAVRETHRADAREPVNELVSIALATGEVGVLASGCDFYAAPAVSPDGTRLAWISWHHPDMPWTRTALWVGEFDGSGAIGSMQCISGGLDASFLQPRWAADGSLYFITDESNWWNLARHAGGETRAVVTREAEFGQPLWQLGNSTYDFLDAGRLVATYCERGLWSLALIDLASGSLERLDLPFTSYRGVRCTSGRVVALAASPSEPEALVRIDPRTCSVETIRRSFQVEQELKDYFSVPEPIAFPTADGTTAHAFHYRPASPRFAAAPGERPPLIVTSHGGPTAASSASLSLARQFWTSRGFAVVDVNYRGSTGYGRDYRFRLERQWGLADVDDCIAAARFLVERGDADGARVGITGGSAGGYTTLCALTFHDYFRTGASHYGIGDLEALARDTHKFESRYLDWLVGPWPEDRDTYMARSPIHHVDRLDVPAAFFQGAMDRVVPPNQAEAMVEALRAKGVPVAYLLFEDEQHGFRKGANIKRALDAELLFFSVWLSGAGLRFSGG